MEDFGAPSFSLGLDLDFNTEPQPTPRKESLCKQSPESSINVSSQTFEDDEGFQPQPLDPDLKVEDPPPTLKRLRRGPSTQSSSVIKRESVKLSSNVDDDIEEFSSQEDSRRVVDEHSSLQARSACSSSKFPLHGHGVLTTQFASKMKAQKSTPASNASTSASLEASSNKLMFPKLTISPLRRFQLLDSDSDDPSVIEDLYKDVNKVDACNKERKCNPSQSMIGNQQKRAKFSVSTHHSEDLWQDFSTKNGVNIPTPALDEFCEEYFSSLKDKNVGQSKEEDIYGCSSKGCQNNSISKLVEQYGNLPNPLPPAYRYFYHDDPRIQRLVRHRLPNFFPLGVANNSGNQQPDAAVIDYMSQFGQRENPTQFHATGKKGLEGSSTQLHGTRNKGLDSSSRKVKKNSKKSNSKEVSQASGNWVNPKSRAKDAGRRRVHADGHSAGHWYTGQDGRKVYVTKNGEELTGQIAYRHFRKESGTGLKWSKKKATSKKKSKR